MPSAANRMPWTVRFFRRHRDDDPAESFPGLVFLASSPDKVRRTLLSILQAVATAAPPSFSGGGMWEAMHGEMAGYFEARTHGPDHRLYRLFCLLEREVPSLDRPAVVVIDGLSKPVGTALATNDYARVRELGEEYRGRTPRNLM